MNTDVLVLCGSVIGAMFLILPLKELKKEYFAFSVAGLSMLIFLSSVKEAKPIISYIKTFSDSRAFSYLKILTKALGITIITSLTSELALDMGMDGISRKVEFFGKVCVLLSALPIYDELISVVNGIL